jgi:hypothetical protein
MRKTLLGRKSICEKLSASKRALRPSRESKRPDDPVRARAWPELYVLVAGLVVERPVVVLVARVLVVAPIVL